MSTTPTPIVPAAGRGRGYRGGGRGGRGGRGHGGEQKRNKGIFKGNTPEMNNNVFECYDKQSDRRQYAKTWQSYLEKK
jgi:hypothetical protein